MGKANENMEILRVTMGDHEQALPVARDKGVSANGALACISMKARHIGEIHSFDKHSDQFHGIVKPQA